MSHIQLTPGPRYLEHAPFKIKAAFFDVDSTLVPDGSPELPTYNFMAMAKEVAEHIPIALISSRPLPKVAHIIERVKAEGISILSNGAQLYDGAGHQMIAERALKISSTIEIARELQRLGVKHWIQDDGLDYRAAGPLTEALAGTLGAYKRPRSLWEHGQESILMPDYIPRKPLVIVAHNVPGELVPDIQALAGAYTRERITSLIGHEEIQPDGTMLYDIFILDSLANKKDALLEVSARLGVPISQMMAVGDGPNDCEVVRYAGVGVAMGNAVEETRSAATFIAPDQAHDGATVALNWLLRSPQSLLSGKF